MSPRERAKALWVRSDSNEETRWESPYVSGCIVWCCWWAYGEGQEQWNYAACGMSRAFGWCDTEDEALAHALLLRDVVLS